MCTDETLHYHSGPDPESGFESHFARAPWFLFYNTRTRQVEAIRNGFMVSDKKRGQNAVQLLSSYHISTVITGKTGVQARNLLMNAHILLHICEREGTVNEVIQEFLLTKKRKPGSTLPGQPPTSSTL